MHDIALPDWAIERGRWLNAFGEIDPARSVLVIVDMQRAFAGEGEVFGNPYARAIIPQVNAVAAAMRAAGGQVIWTRQTVSDDPPLAMAPWQYDPADETVRAAMAALAAESPSHDLHPDMVTATDDLVIDKYRYSAFACPDAALERALGAFQPDMLLIAGTLSNVCCESTARDAYMLGFKVIFIADATAAKSDEEHNAALLNLRLNFADVHMNADVISLLDGQNSRNPS